MTTSYRNGAIYVRRGECNAVTPVLAGTLLPSERGTAIRVLMESPGKPSG